MDDRIPSSSGNARTGWSSFGSYARFDAWRFR
jgi:hypothetical protein